MPAGAACGKGRGAGAGPSSVPWTSPRQPHTPTATPFPPSGNQRMDREARLGALLSLWHELGRPQQEGQLASLCKDCPELLPELRSRLRAIQHVEWLNQG